MSYCFKFQYGATNILESCINHLCEKAFKFQYGATNITYRNTPYNI